MTLGSAPVAADGEPEVQRAPVLWTVRPFVPQCAWICFLTRVCETRNRSSINAERRTVHRVYRSVGATTGER